MDTYSLLRQIADSWVLLAMFGFFLSAAIWAFLPSQNKAREDARMIPFREEKTKSGKGCSDTCESRASAVEVSSLKGQDNV